MLNKIKPPLCNYGNFSVSVIETRNIWLFLPFGPTVRFCFDLFRKVNVDMNVVKSQIIKNNVIPSGFFYQFGFCSGIKINNNNFSFLYVRDKDTGNVVVIVFFYHINKNKGRLWVFAPCYGLTISESTGILQLT